MKNIGQFNRKIQQQFEALNNFVLSLKKTIPEFENAKLTIDDAYKNQNCCFQLTLGVFNGVYLRGSNVCDYNEMNSYLLGYMRRWENEQRIIKASEQNKTNL